MPAWLKPTVGVLAAFGLACVGLLLSNWLASSDVLLAVAVGVIAQLIFRSAFGLLAAFVLGFATLALPIIYHELFSPSVSGGASMWPLAILFSGPIFGSIAAVAAVIVGVSRGDLRHVKRHVP